MVSPRKNRPLGSPVSGAAAVDEASQALAAASEPSQAPADLPRVGGRFIAAYTLASFGYFLVILMPSLFSLAYKVQTVAPAQKETILGVVVGVGALVNILVMPVFGVLSDRTTLRWGRRRPWLVLGVLISAIGAR